jgi:acetylornithine/succinyldiaminopimelate/putrescine aminotransferase
MAKPIGGGLPLGAVLATQETAGVLEPGMHGTTFGGNPVACAAGIATMNEIVENNLMQRAADLGSHFLARLNEIASFVPSKVREVRGLGLMLGMELDQEGEPVVAALREEGILINCTDQTVLRFLPPLIIQRDHIDHLVPVLTKALKALP